MYNRHAALSGTFKTNISTSILKDGCVITYKFEIIFITIRVILSLLTNHAHTISEIFKSLTG